MKGRVIGAAAALALAGCGGSISTSDVQTFVASNFEKSVTEVASAPSDETVALTSNECVQATDNTWNCVVAYTVTAPAESLNEDLQATLNVTCDSSGNCEWPAFVGQPVNP